jgi:hypothetical protein
LGWGSSWERHREVGEHPLCDRGAEDGLAP